MSYYAKKIDDKIIDLIKNGGVGLLPTDTIYGLSALALNKEAVEKVHGFKGRSAGKPLIVLIADVSQLDMMGLSKDSIEPIKEHWPGPLSVEFNASSAPAWLHRGKNYFAVRMPDNKDLLDLVLETGPIVSSSANKEGQRPASSTEEAKEYFGDKLDFYVDAGKIIGQPSTLVKIENGNIKVLRQGACVI